MANEFDANVRNVDGSIGSICVGNRGFRPGISDVGCDDGWNDVAICHTHDPRIFPGLQKPLFDTAKIQLSFYLILPPDMAVIQRCHGSVAVAVAWPACFVSHDGD